MLSEGDINGEAERGLSGGKRTRSLFVVFLSRSELKKGSGKETVKRVQFGRAGPNSLGTQRSNVRNGGL